MERIKLSKSEKTVLRRIALRVDGLPDGMGGDCYFAAVLSLTDKGLVDSRVNYNKIIDVRLSQRGKAYMIENPKLRNPVDWAKISAIAACATAIATMLALFLR